jgi:hypothetical protein
MPTPSVITSSLQSFVCLSAHPPSRGILFFHNCFLWPHEKVALQMGKEKREMYNSANEKWSNAFMPGSYGIGSEREDQRACKRQPTLFAEVPTRKGILRIAIRKEKKP